MAVVVIDKHGQRPLEMPRIEDEQPVKTLGPSGSDEPFRDPIGFRHLNGRANDAGPLRLEHRIEALRKLAIVIAQQKAHWLVALNARHETCRACCVTHSPSGCAVQPARCRRRLPTPMKNSTYRR